MKIDHIDRKILTVLQGDVTIALDNLGERVGLSRNACWRRIKALDSAGIIARRVTLLDADKVGLGLTVFMRIRAERQDPAWLDNLRDVTDEIPEILCVYRMSGETGFLLHLQVADVARYDDVRRQLADRIALGDVSAEFVLEEIKHTTALPL